MIGETLSFPSSNIFLRWHQNPSKSVDSPETGGEWEEKTATLPFLMTDAVITELFKKQRPAAGRWGGQGGEGLRVFSTFQDQNASVDLALIDGLFVFAFRVKGFKGPSEHVFIATHPS